MDKEGRREWDGKSRGGRFGHQFFVWTIRVFGVRSAYWLLALIVVYFIPFAPKATRSIWQYNRRRRGLGRGRSMWELYCHYYVFGQTLIDKVAMKGGLAGKYKFEFDNYDRFIEVLNGGQGVVMIGAHVGCWEAGAAFFGKYGAKINIVMFDAEHRQIKEVIEQSAECGDNYKVIAVNRDAIDAMVQIKIALNEGEYICFNGDRYVDEHSTVAKRLMGAEVRLPSGPFRIAAKCRVPVVFYYAMRETGRKYRFVFEEPRAVSRNGAEDLIEQYVESLERILRRYPRQWFNFYDFWKEEGL